MIRWILDTFRIPRRPVPDTWPKPIYGIGYKRGAPKPEPPRMYHTRMTYVMADGTEIPLGPHTWAEIERRARTCPFLYRMVSFTARGYMTRERALVATVLALSSEREKLMAERRLHLQFQTHPEWPYDPKH